MGGIVDVKVVHKFRKCERLENVTMTVDDERLRFSSSHKIESFKIQTLKKQVHVSKSNLISIRLAAENSNERGYLNICFRDDPKNILNLLNDHVDKHPTPKKRTLDKYANWRSLYNRFMFNSKSKTSEMKELGEQKENAESSEKKKGVYIRKNRNNKNIEPRKIMMNANLLADNQFEKTDWIGKHENSLEKPRESIQRNDSEPKKKNKLLKRPSLNESPTSRYPKRVKQETSSVLSPNPFQSLANFQVNKDAQPAQQKRAHDNALENIRTNQVVQPVQLRTISDKISHRQAVQAIQPAQQKRANDNALEDIQTHQDLQPVQQRSISDEVSSQQALQAKQPALTPAQQKRASDHALEKIQTNQVVQPALQKSTSDKVSPQQALQAIQPAQQKRASDKTLVKQETIEESPMQRDEIILPPPAIPTRSIIQNQNLIGERLFDSSVSYSRLSSCHVTDTVLTNCTVEHSALIACTIERE